MNMMPTTGYRTAAAGLAFCAGTVLGQPGSVDYCQYGERTNLILVDLTTAYDDTDRIVFAEGISSIINALDDGAEDRTQAGDRVRVLPITEASVQSRPIFDGCLPGCPDQSLLGSVVSAIGLGLSECSDVTSKVDRRRFTADLGRQASGLLSEVREYPHSDITRTLARVTAHYGDGQDSVGGKLGTVYIFSDLIEHSEHMPWPSILEQSPDSLLDRLRSNGIEPNLSGAIVRVFGFGRRHGEGRKQLALGEETQLRTFWTRFFEANGAASVTIETRLEMGSGVVSSSPARARRPDAPAVAKQPPAPGRQPPPPAEPAGLDDLRQPPLSLGPRPSPASDSSRRNEVDAAQANEPVSVANEGDLAPSRAPRSQPTQPPAPDFDAGTVRSSAKPEFEPFQQFRDCRLCPEMVVVPPGEFQMGSLAFEDGRDDSEGPRHPVRIAEAFAVSIMETTVRQMEAFQADTDWAWDMKCDRRNRSRPPDHPAVCVGWRDAAAYADWLAHATGKPYRLPTEAEWEYMARAGTDTTRHWGNGSEDLCRYANVKDARVGGRDAANCRDSHKGTGTVGSYEPNDWGIHDVLGNVFEWTQDCWRGSYRGAPVDGSAWFDGDCRRRVLRGGSFRHGPDWSRSASRNHAAVDERREDAGFRVVRAITR